MDKATIANALERWLSEAEREGELRGLRAGLACVLRARALTLSDLGNARVDACDDVAILTRFLDRATTARCEADVFAGGNAGEQLKAEGFALGFERSREQVHVSAMQLALTTLIAARRLPLSAAGGERLAACTDLGMLTRWMTRAATASSEAELFADDGAAARPA